MGFFDTKTPEEQFKNEITRKSYHDAKALIYGKNLNPEFITEVISSEYKKFMDEKDDQNARKIQKTFEAYLMTPKERLADKIENKDYYPALEVAKFEKFSLKFKKDLVASAHEKLLKEGDTENAEEILNVFKNYFEEQDSIERESQRFNPLKNWVCPKCKKNEFDVNNIAVCTPGYSSIVDIQDQQFTVVTCRECKYTEMYKAKMSDLLHSLDFIF